MSKRTRRHTAGPPGTIEPLAQSQTFPLKVLHQLVNNYWLPIPHEGTRELVEYLLNRRPGRLDTADFLPYMVALKPIILARYPWLELPQDSLTPLGDVAPVAEMPNAIATIRIVLAPSEAETEHHLAQLRPEHGTSLLVPRLTRAERAVCQPYRCRYHSAAQKGLVTMTRPFERLGNLLANIPPSTSYKRKYCRQS